MTSIELLVASATTGPNSSGFENFWAILSKPDNIPIVAMLFLVLYFFGLSIKMGLENDRLTEKGEKDKIYDKMNRWVYGANEDDTAAPEGKG